MQEFSSINVSSYEAGSLAERLTEQSRDGWHVVAIVPTGSSVTAYLARESAGRDTGPVASETSRDTSPSFEPTPADEPTAPTLGGTATAIAPEPASEPAAEAPSDLAGFASDVTSGASSDSTSHTTSHTTSSASDLGSDNSSDLSGDVSDSGAAATGAAPAGWYADPSGRYELRYWDGGQWTEHVSRAGQQYTDPPVA